jgi:hypothetical protein
VFYLHEGKTKNGKDRYFYSMKPDGILAAAIPPGFETYETPNCQVVLRKITPCRVSSEEMTAVWAAVRANAKVRGAYVEARGDAVIVFTPDIDVEEKTADMLARAPIPIVNTRRLRTILERSQSFSPMMRFVLLDEKTREYAPQRWCFSSGIDDWVYIGGSGPLPELARRFCRHLGRESLFELM